MHAEKLKTEKDSDSVEKQIQQIKNLVKNKGRIPREEGVRSLKGAEFPIRFCAKPFVHYGYSAKIAAQKKKEAKDLI